MQYLERIQDKLSQKRLHLLTYPRKRSVHALLAAAWTIL